MNIESRQPLEQLHDEKLEKLYKRHLKGALVRSGASMAMWTVALMAFFAGAINEHSLIGISASVLYLILINPPALIGLKYITSRRLYEYFSLFINQLEVFGYTSIIYFCGGIEASHLVLLYAALIAYVGVVAPRKHPFIVASLCVVTYNLMVGLVHLGYIPQIHLIPGGHIPPLTQLWILPAVTGLLYVVAYISATTANMLKMHKDKLYKQNIELVRANDRLGREIDERKQAEEALQEGEEKYRNLFNNAHVGMYRSRISDGKFVEANDAFARMFGYEDRTDILEAEYVTADNYVDPDTRETLLAIIREHGEFRNFEARLYRKDRSVAWFRYSGRIYPEKGYIEGVAADITEEKRLKEQLLQAQKMEAIGTLAGGIAHNFNNLLTGILGNASLLLMDIDSEHPYYEKLKNIEKQVQNGSKLTAQLIGFAREGKYEVKSINLNQVVQETSKAFGLTRKEVVIHQELDDKLYGIKADQEQLEQTLLNLYVNAVDAMTEGGNFFLKTQNVTHKDMTGKPYDPKPGNYILLTIRDDGAGMDKETMERIFEPFFTTKGLAEGTGLGLASAYGIIKAHGGYIHVNSEKGHGTTFSIYLPSLEEAVKDKKGLSGEIVKGKESVLLVDDEEMVLDIGEQMLAKLGYEVLSATSGIEALKLYEKNQDKIDMVLLDMVMPGMGGGKTYDKMREINSHIKVLLASGYSVDGQATEILERGCDGFIQKPFNMKDLSQKIREILES